MSEILINNGNGHFTDSEGRTKKFKKQTFGLYNPIKESSSVDLKEIDGTMISESEIDVQEVTEELNEETQEGKIQLV